MQRLIVAHSDRCLIDVDQSETPRVEVCMYLTHLTAHLFNAFPCQERYLEVQARQVALSDIQTLHVTDNLLGAPVPVALMNELLFNFGACRTH